MRITQTDNYKAFGIGLMALLIVILMSSCGKEGDNNGGTPGGIGGPPIAPGAGTGAGGQGRGPASVNLGAAGDFVILAKSGISNVPTSSITGDIGVSPATDTAITGFGLTMDGSGTFSTSAQINGQVFASTYAAPTPANLTVAVLAMQAAYTDAASRAPDQTELGAGNIGGLTLPPGVYKWSTGVTIQSNVTLSGGANDTWIFQIAQNLTMASARDIILAGGAQAQNVTWQVFGVAEIGTTSHFQGVLLSQTSIVVKTGASVTGRLMAQTAVTLDSNVITP
jgi:hypothetical protein